MFNLSPCLRAPRLLPRQPLQMYVPGTAHTNREFSRWPGYRDQDAGLIADLKQHLFEGFDDGTVQDHHFVYGN
jgi:hypothetical protein